MTAAVAERAEGQAGAVAPHPSRRLPRRRPAAQRHVASGVVWIAVVGILLAGVVAMNVAVLRLNLRMDELGRERVKLRAENAQLASQLASAAASARIEQLASRQFGLVAADPSRTTYVDLRR